MDHLSRADAALAAAASHSPAVLVPGRVTSPMDCATTTPVPRRVVQMCEERAGIPSDGLGQPDVFAADPEAGHLMDREMRRLSDGPGRSSPARHTA